MRVRRCATLRAAYRRSHARAFRFMRHVRAHAACYADQPKYKLGRQKEAEIVVNFDLAKTPSSRTKRSTSIAVE